MAYEKKTWEDGEVITADKMNNLESLARIGYEEGFPERIWVGEDGTVLTEEPSNNTSM